MSTPRLPHRPSPRWLPAFAVGLVGCTTPDWQDLAFADDWRLVAEGADPWPGRPSDAPACPERAVYEETGSIEIDTDLCDWVTITAPSRHQVQLGEAVDFLFFHSALAADDPTQATMGLAFGEEIVWTLTVPVPSAGGFYTPDRTAPVAVREGDPLYLHVHNHGANTYQLGHLRAWTRP